MSFENILWQVVLPLVVGFATGFWVRSALKAGISIVCTLATIAFAVFLWEAYAHQPTLLEGLGVAQRPDPIQQTLTLAKATLKALPGVLALLPSVAYVGFAAGITAAITRAIICRPEKNAEYNTDRLHAPPGSSL